MNKKYLVLLCDGMSDEPLQQLNGKTPMQAAHKPNMDTLAKASVIGLCKTVADGLKPGSDVANLSVLGYDPTTCYSGRSPLEAVSIGINLSDEEITFRCNLVTLSDEDDFSHKTMCDYSGGDISTADAKVLIEYLQQQLDDEIFAFYPGVAYRHCVVSSLKTFSPNDKILTLTPPHDISGRVIADYLPKGENSAKILDLTLKAHKLLSEHPLNKARENKGLLPANSIWLWGAGTKPQLPDFYEKFGKKGSVISAVDLLKGIAICAGMTSVDVPGATGYIDTDFAGKANAAIAEFERGQDLVYVHIEAPDECGHRGEIENKVKAIELIDERVLAPMLQYLQSSGEFKILICPDHPTPLAIKTHTSKPVPFLMYDSTAAAKGCDIFSEASAQSTGNYIPQGYMLMQELLK
ncbi:MAG: cofactor-independent phosphoglycerate mutase [Oscillospiraceae bacterium]|jgi:2,3-bisphosphoglycerate-independent phosphoglycerate mutase|nr:cofactor-independent phosphoglycerate mutase [Oscillospiraceae bacterium]